MCAEPGFGESEYKGPFTPNTEVTSSDQAFITEFSGNIIGYVPGTDDHNVHGVFTDSDGVYLASYNDYNDENIDYVHYFPQHEGPMFMVRDGETFDEYQCYGDLCTTADYIFTAGKNSSNQYSVYKVPKKDGENDDGDKSEMRVQCFNAYNRYGIILSTR